jgi:hypothetical protein
MTVRWAATNSGGQNDARAKPSQRIATIDRYLKNEGQMPNIVVFCTLTGTEAPTGLTTEMVQFDKLPRSIAMEFRCPNLQTDA